MVLSATTSSEAFSDKIQKVFSWGDLYPVLRRVTETFPASCHLPFGIVLYHRRWTNQQRSVECCMRLLLQEQGVVMICEPLELCLGLELILGDLAFSDIHEDVMSKCEDGV